jgi:hypothetical protein
MSQFFLNTMAGPIPPSIVETLTGNDSIAVGPTANNINVIGANGILVSGNAATSTLTISPVEVVLTGTATTTGATTANINVDIPVSSNSIVSVRANIAGYDSTAMLGVGGEMLASVKNVAGVLSIVGVPDRTKNSDTALNDTSWTLITSGTNALIQVTGTGSGGGSDVINWRANIDIVSAP